MGPRTHRLVFEQECAAPDPPDLHERNHRFGANVVALQMKPTPVFLAFAILATFIGCPSAKDTSVPAGLRGVWTTAAPQYEDRFLQFTKDSIIFGTGDNSYDIHAITKIEKAHEATPSLYTISHVNPEGQEYRFSFYYDPAHDGVITFKNQDNIRWKKESGH